MLEIGSVVDGKYKILNVVGKGGMSVVYLAMNERANKQWAIKEVRTDGVQDSMVVKQNLLAETDILKSLSHPHLPSIVDVIDRPSEGTFLIVMDYIEGRPLSKLIEENGAQSEEDVIEWAKQLCDVFGYLHSRKPPIIYRDMKPSNVMLKPDGNIAVIDFGTAREYKGGKSEDTTLLGTKGYAAPEQYGGNGETDARTDIYNLGATMYHLLTGVRPDDTTVYYGMVRDIREINPNLSFGISRIVAKCTMDRPDDRYQSAAELYYDLVNPPTPSPIINIKWRTFLASAILTIVMFICSAGFSLAHGSQLSSTYDSYIEKGDSCVNTGDNTEAYNQYVNAINVDPGNYEAYARLLEMYTDDEWLSHDEYIKISELITGHEEELTSDANVADYADYVAYDLGVYLSLSYTADSGVSSDNGIPLSISYLDVAQNYANDSKNRQIAELLYNMSSMYGNVGGDREDKFGNAKIDVDEYWSTLAQLASTETVDLAGEKIAAMIYSNVTSQIVLHYNWFIESGDVETSEVSTVINNIESISSKIESSNASQEMIENYTSNIETIRHYIGEEE